MLLGFTVTCCPDPTQIAAYAREVHPEVIFGVPRVWEKVYAGVRPRSPPTRIASSSSTTASPPRCEIKAAERAGTATQEQLDTWAFLDAVAFSTVRELVGLDAVVVGHHRAPRRSAARSSSGSTPSACRCRRSTA